MLDETQPPLPGRAESRIGDETKIRQGDHEKRVAAPGLGPTPVQHGMERPLSTACRTIQPGEQPERTLGHPDRTCRVDEVIGGRKPCKEPCDRPFAERTGMTQTGHGNGYN